MGSQARGPAESWFTPVLSRRCPNDPEVAFHLGPGSSSVPGCSWTTQSLNSPGSRPCPPCHGQLPLYSHYLLLVPRASPGLLGWVHLCPGGPRQKAQEALAGKLNLSLAVMAIKKEFLLPGSTLVSLKNSLNPRYWFSPSLKYLQ